MSDDIVAFTSAHLFAFARIAAVATLTRTAAPNLTAALYNPQVYELGKWTRPVAAECTVQTILAARIDRLSPEDKRLLQSAAVIGKDVPFALLATIADEGEEELRRGLSRLQAAEFLYEVSLFPDLEYTFKHALTHEVAYGSVLGERRQALHAGIVDGMSVVYRDRAAELGLGKVYRQAANKRDQAQEHVTTAATMFRDMDMRFWPAQAEAGT